MNGWHLGGLDARSVMVGAGLVLAGMVAARAGGLVPLFVIGGVIWFVGTRKGWWGERRRDARRGPLASPPAVFEDWHRQMHTAQAHGHGHGNGHGPMPAPQPPATAAWQAAAAPATPAAPVRPQPQDAEIRIPVRQAGDGSSAPEAPEAPQTPVSPYAADYQRTVGENWA